MSLGSNVSVVFVVSQPSPWNIVAGLGAAAVLVWAGLCLLKKYRKRK